MASTVLDPIAEVIAATITAVAGLNPPLSGRKWSPGLAGIDPVPAGVVGVPTIERTPAGAGESQLGATDWRLNYPVDLVFDLSEAVYTQAQAVEAVEAFIKKVDADPTLGGQADLFASVVEAEPVELLDEKRPQLIYRCRVQIHKLVPQI